MNNMVNGKRFEAKIKSLLRHEGFTVRYTKATRDNGEDLIALSRAPLVSGKYVVQCKRTSTVGLPEVKQLIGTVEDSRATKGILFTSGEFSAEAKRLARRNKTKIELFDGQMLKLMLHEQRRRRK